MPVRRLCSITDCACCCARGADRNRGWCIAEESVTFEVLTRAAHYPALQEAMLYPPRSKVFLLHSNPYGCDACPQPTYVAEYAHKASDHVLVDERLSHGFFTGKGPQRSHTHTVPAWLPATGVCVVSPSPLTRRAAWVPRGCAAGKGDAVQVRELFRTYQIKVAEAAITGDELVAAAKQLQKAKRRAPKGVNPEFLAARANAHVELGIAMASGMVDDENEKEKAAQQVAATRLQALRRGQLARRARRLVQVERVAIGSPKQT